MPESLGSRLLKSIYFPNFSILDATLGSHPSQVWRAITEGRDTLKQRIKHIGNGETTRIQEDNWFSRDEMLRPYGCLVPNPSELVSDLIDVTSATWNKQLIERTFTPMDGKVIMGIPICTRNLKDFLCQHFERNGCLTIKSAYKMLEATKTRWEAWLNGNAGSSSTNSDEGSWKYLWKTQVPTKIRMFLWCLSKKNLLTKDVRDHRHMSSTTSCGLCGAPDSWRHSLLDYAMSRCTWALVD